MIDFPLPVEGLGGWLKLKCDVKPNGGSYDDKGLREPVYFTLGVDGNIFAGFTLAPMPGCCGVVVSIHSSSDGRIPSAQFHTIKQNVAKALGYGLMICTTDTTNVPQIVGGARSGWKWGEQFVNPRTNNRIVVGVKKL